MSDDEILKVKADISEAMATLKALAQFSGGVFKGMGQEISKHLGGGGGGGGGGPISTATTALIGGAAGGAAASLVGALKSAVFALPEFSKRLTESEVALGNFSEESGTSVDHMGGLVTAFQGVGVSVEQLRNQYARLGLRAEQEFPRLTRLAKDSADHQIDNNLKVQESHLNVAKAAGQDVSVQEERLTLIQKQTDARREQRRVEEEAKDDIVNITAAVKKRLSGEEVDESSVNLTPQNLLKAGIAIAGERSGGKAPTEDTMRRVISDISHVFQEQARPLNQAAFGRNVSGEQLELQKKGSGEADRQSYEAQRFGYSQGKNEVDIGVERNKLWHETEKIWNAPGGGAEGLATGMAATVNWLAKIYDYNTNPKNEKRVFDTIGAEGVFKQDLEAKNAAQGFTPDKKYDFEKSNKELAKEKEEAKKKADDQSKKDTDEKKRNDDAAKRLVQTQQEHQEDLESKIAHGALGVDQAKFNRDQLGKTQHKYDIKNDETGEKFRSSGGQLISEADDQKIGSSKKKELDKRAADLAVEDAERNQRLLEQQQADQARGGGGGNTFQQPNLPINYGLGHDPSLTNQSQTGALDKVSSAADKAADSLEKVAEAADKNGGVEQKKAGGGPIVGRGTGTSDSILARVSNGEYVVRADGSNLGDAINHFSGGFRLGGLVSRFSPGIPGFARGGAVSGAGGSGGGGRPLHLTIGDHTFGPLHAPNNVAEALTKYAIGKGVVSAGPKPGWFG